MVDATPSAELERQGTQLQEAYRAEREHTVRMTIRKALGSLQRRSNQQTALGSVGRNIELRLEMLEKSLPYLKSRLADPNFELLAPEIDSALAGVGSADALELTVEEIFDQPSASVPP